MGTKKEVRERRKKVLRGVIWGKDTHELANELGVVPRTIQKDMQAVKEEIGMEMAGKTVAYILGELQLKARDRERVLNNIVAREIKKLDRGEEPDDYKLMKALRALREEADCIPKYMNQLGLIQNQNPGHIPIRYERPVRSGWENVNILAMLRALREAENKLKEKEAKEEDEIYPNSEA